jgi:hypothetical protein
MASALCKVMPFKVNAQAVSGATSVTDHPCVRLRIAMLSISTCRPRMVLPVKLKFMLCANAQRVHIAINMVEISRFIVVQI